MRQEVYSEAATMQWPLVSNRNIQSMPIRHEDQRALGG
jgi:hypothetical protein